MGYSPFLPHAQKIVEQVGTIFPNFEGGAEKFARACLQIFVLFFVLQFVPFELQPKQQEAPAQGIKAKGHPKPGAA